MGSNQTDIVPVSEIFQKRSTRRSRKERSFASTFNASQMMMMRSSDTSAPYASAWNAQDQLDDEEDEDKIIRILITGFGPFRDHTVNASWEAVKLINPDDILYLARQGRDSTTSDEFLMDPPMIQITFCELEVVYNTIHQVVPELWEKYKPDLTVHVGVSGIAKAITLEQHAHNSDYCSPDIKGCLPCRNQCVSGGCDNLTSGINMTSVAKRVNTIVNRAATSINSETITTGLTTARSGLRSGLTGYPTIPRHIRAEVSTDPGRFLCDFIYYRSLNIDKDRTAFIHVPPLNKPYNAEELSLAISLCVSEFIQQLFDKKLLNH